MRFAPEIVKMIQFVESSEVASSLIAKHLGLSTELKAKGSTKTTENNKLFQTNLLKVRQAFESAVSAIKLTKNHVIFIDGIDIRPSDIAYADYFDCVRGLIEATWTLNSDFLGNIKDSPGRIRVVLLVRPDIFLRVGLHNTNTKLRDNSVFLNWGGSYKDYRGSMLFRVADRLLSSQQADQPAKLGEMWDYYFPFHAVNVGMLPSVEGGVDSFLAFMRFSYHRPRDINSMMRTMRDMLRNKRNGAQYVTAEDFNDPSFRDAHAEYLLGEIRDQLLFYYSQDEYDLFLQFFPHLRGKRRFTYGEFVSAFNEFIAECSDAKKQLPQFFDTANAFLQFLFEQNVICYKERSEDTSANPEPFIRWCFRERTLSNMAPKVRVGVEYEIFYGLSKALNVGRTVQVGRPANQQSIGTIAQVFEEKGFGFIRGGEQQSEYYFKLSQFLDGRKHLLRPGIKVRFVAEVKYGKLRARDVWAVR